MTVGVTLVYGFLNKCGVPSEVYVLGDSGYFPTRKPGEIGSGPHLARFDRSKGLLSSSIWMRK